MKYASKQDEIISSSQNFLKGKNVNNAGKIPTLPKRRDCQQSVSRLICGLVHINEILVLGYTHPEQFYMLRRYRLTQTVVDISYARLLNTYGKKLKVHLKIDTGMHRLGIPADRKEEIARVFNYRNLVITGIFTHLCAADVRTAEQEKFTMGQAAAFDRVIYDLNKRGLNCGKIHLLSSDGLLQYPELAGDYARIGIALYGVSQGTDMESCRINLRPVLSVKARVALVVERFK